MEKFRVRDGRSFAAAALGKSHPTVSSSSHHFLFERVDEEALVRFNKAFIGKVEKASNT